MESADLSLRVAVAGRSACLVTHLRYDALTFTRQGRTTRERAGDSRLPKSGRQREAAAVSQGPCGARLSGIAATPTAATTQSKIRKP